VIDARHLVRGWRVQEAGIGVLDELTSPAVANAIFAATVGLLAVTAFVLGARTSLSTPKRYLRP
jgi:hypothetical protein